MKTIITFCLMLGCLQVFAQDGKPSLSDLYISNAPGLILADKSTLTVDKPTTPRAFALSVINLAQGGAVEISPYWLFNHPNGQYTDYIQKKFLLLETLNISLANYKSDNVFTMAPGIRTELIRAYSKKSVAGILSKYREIQNALAVLDLPKIKSLKKQIDSLSLKGQFTVEVAAAVLGNSTSGPFKNLYFNKKGAWMNVGLTPRVFPLGFVAMARYSWANDKTASDNNVSKYLDFGAQTNYTTTKITLAAEYVNRRDFSAVQNYSKLSASFSYNITENINLVASYGKDLKSGDGTFALFGLNFGLERSK